MRDFTRWWYNGLTVLLNITKHEITKIYIEISVFSVQRHIQ